MEKAEDLPQPEIDHYYGPLRFFTQQVVKGDGDLLLLNAPAGIGKSYQINKVVKADCTGHYVPKAGYISPLELFHSLHETRNEGDILFLDDVSGITDDERALNILKGATWTEDEDRGRMVEWATTSDKIKCEQEFQYNGRIILCFNEMPDNEHINALKSRGKYYEMNFTYEQRIDIIHEIAKVPYEDSTLEERQEVAEWIGHYTDATFEDLNLRILFHCLDIYLSCKSGDYEYALDDWTMLATELFGVDEDLQLVKDLLTECGTKEAAAEAFEARTGQSRRTFFRRKKKLEEKLGKKV